MFNAIIRSKLMYGHETMVMNTIQLKKLDVYQLKGLRTILKLHTTYVNREYPNDYITLKHNEHLRSIEHKPFIPLS